MVKMTKQEIERFVDENYRASFFVRVTATDLLQAMMEDYPEDDSEVDINQLMLDSEYSNYIERNEWAIMENYQYYKNANRDEALELFEDDIIKLFTKMIGKEQGGK